MADSTRARSGNIVASDPGTLVWKPDQAQKSLEEIRLYVESEAKKAIDWYFDEKKWKARLSRWIRLWALILTAAGGLLPVAFYLLREYELIAEERLSTSGLWASVLVGLAAGLLGLDRAFGFSSAWARYVLAGTEIRRRLEEFRMDWIALSADAGTTLTSDRIAVLLQKSKEFRLGVESIVGEETKDWVNEFQSSLAQIEKDAKAQIETLRTEVERTRLAQREAVSPGGVHVTIANADRIKDFTWFVTLEGPEGPIASSERVAHGKTWARVNVKPAQYRLSIHAALPDDTPVAAEEIVVLKPGAIEHVSLTLPIA